MDEISLHEAVENISLIKEVINRTSKSFLAFSKIFIYWGLLFILQSVFTLFVSLNKEQAINLAAQHPILNYLFLGVLTIFAVLIYITVAKKVPLLGLEKKLMTVWILVLIMNTIPAKIIINNAGGASNPVSISVSNFSTMLFSLAIALIVTALFTGYNHLRNLGIIYIVISLLHAYLRIPVFEEGTIIQFLGFIALPFTFIYTGFFLKSRKPRGI